MNRCSNSVMANYLLIIKKYASFCIIFCTTSAIQCESTSVPFDQSNTHTWPRMQQCCSWLEVNFFNWKSKEYFEERLLKIQTQSMLNIEKPLKKCKRNILLLVGGIQYIRNSECDLFRVLTEVTDMSCCACAAMGNKDKSTLLSQWC